MKDEDYEKLEVTPCDVKSIQNIPKGVCDFWMKALVNHPVGQTISEKDRPILGYLQNIELDLHPQDKDDGYDLIFTFAPNNYFDGTVITKSVVKKGDTPVKTSTPIIKWKDACNPTIKKQKKKKKGKKVTVEVKCESFFGIFDNVDPEAIDKTKKKDDKPEEENDLEEEDEMNIKLQEDTDIADQIKDDLVPLALEYYLGVIENEMEDEDEDDDEDGDDSDDGNKKKKAKKGAKQVGPDGKECKQQ